MVLMELNFWCLGHPFALCTFYKCVINFMLPLFSKITSFYYIANHSFYFPRNMRSHLKFQFGVLLYTTLNRNTIHEGQNRNFIFILQILAVPFSKSCHLNFNRRNFFFLSIVLKGLAMIIVFWDKNNWKNTRRIWS